MTREEEIRQAAITIAKEWYCGPEEDFHMEIEKLTEAIQWADEHPKNPWINIRHILPNKNSLYLVRTTDDNYYIDYYNISLGFDIIRVQRKTITHWMPIPELPKGEQL